MSNKNKEIIIWEIDNIVNLIETINLNDPNIEKTDIVETKTVIQNKTITNRIFEIFWREKTIHINEVIWQKCKIEIDDYILDVQDFRDKNEKKLFLFSKEKKTFLKISLKDNMFKSMYLTCDNKGLPHIAYVVWDWVASICEHEVEVVLSKLEEYKNIILSFITK
jgi:hypothetical protein